MFSIKNWDSANTTGFQHTVSLARWASWLHKVFSIHGSERQCHRQSGNSQCVHISILSLTPTLNSEVAVVGPDQE